MIKGAVSPGLEALICFSVRSSTGTEISIEAIIDTGFTDFLTLAPDVVAALALPHRTDMDVMLGDGSIVSLPVYEAVVIWDGQDRTIFVHAAEGGALVGMSMLHGHELRMQVVPSGDVLIRAMPRSRRRTRP
jgi:clan AA aspartic protease